MLVRWVTVVAKLSTGTMSGEGSTTDAKCIFRARGRADNGFLTPSSSMMVSARRACRSARRLVADPFRRGPATLYPPDSGSSQRSDGTRVLGPRTGTAIHDSCSSRDYCRGSILCRLGGAADALGHIQPAPRGGLGDQAIDWAHRARSPTFK